MTKQNDDGKQRRNHSIQSPVLDCYEIVWPQKHKDINAFTTHRTKGISKAPFDSLNLAHHVNDVPQDINSNRAILYRFIEQNNPGFCENKVAWLNQTHSTKVLQTSDVFAKSTNENATSEHATSENATSERSANDADGLISTQAHDVCCVLTADCLPVFIADIDANVVSVVHAGWRGLCNGIIENALTMATKALSALPINQGIGFDALKEKLQVAFGPAIGPCCFEVGQSVKDEFIAHYPDDADCFRLTLQGNNSADNKYHANIYQLAIARAKRYGVKWVGEEPQQCTVCQSSQYYSYRRESVCGRMASVIWRNRVE